MLIIGCLVVVLLSVAVEAAEAERVVIVDVAERTLTLYVDGEAVKTYPVAIGKSSSPTPIGSFKVISNVANPSYYNPAVGKYGPGEKGNPVGTRWIGLDKKGYGIHGTNAPRSIGRAASRGCIRMRNRDAEDLARHIQVGDSVEIRTARDAATGELADGGSEQDPPRPRADAKKMGD